MSALSETKESATESNSDDTNLLDKIWMVRPCDIYVEEYKECTSKKGREHQMYIFGRHMDCSRWQEDKENCFKLRENNDSSAAIEIIKHELIRREKRLAAARNNDVWEYRTGPPDDWDKPLTEWMEKTRVSHLSKIQKKLEKAEEEAKGEAEGEVEAIDKRPSCVVS